MRHVLSALVQNVPGVLAHISGMLASRGYNIDSLAVGTTEDPGLSRMTFVVSLRSRRFDSKSQKAVNAVFGAAEASGRTAVSVVGRSAC